MLVFKVCAQRVKSWP